MKSTDTLLSSFRDPFVPPRRLGKAVFCLSFLYLLASHANAKCENKQRSTSCSSESCIHFKDLNDTPTILHLYDSAKTSSPSEHPIPASAGEPIRSKDKVKSPKPTSETPTSNPTLLSLTPEPVAATKTPLPTPHTGVPETSNPTSTPPYDTSTSTPTPHAIASETSHPISTSPIPIPISEPTHSAKPGAKNTTQKPNLLDPSPPTRSTHESSRPTQSQSIKPTQVPDKNFSTIIPTNESYSASPQARSPTEAPRTSSATSKPKIESLTPTITLRLTTEKPTRKPSGGLTSDPTPHPTLSPKPSLHPSAQPSYPLQISKMIRNIVMVFDDCEWLGPSSVDTWVSVTENFIVSEIMRMADERNILYLDCNIFFRKQFIPTEDFNSNDAARNRRHLQSSPLAIQFDQQFELRSSVQSHPYQKYFIETLDTAEKQSKYINELQNSGDPIFNSINTVKVTLGGHDISQPSSVTSIPKPSNIGPVTGIAVGIFFASVLTASLVILRRYNQYKSKVKKAFSTHGDSLYINVSSNSPDVSTLSLPTGTFITQSMRFEDLTAGESTIKYDYEYKKYMPSTIMNQNLSDNPSMCIGQTKRNELLGGEKVQTKETRPENQDSGAITCDEGSFDEIFRSGSGGLEEMTQLPSEPVVPTDVSMNVDSTTNTIYPYNERVLS